MILFYISVLICFFYLEKPDFISCSSNYMFDHEKIFFGTYSNNCLIKSNDLGKNFTLIPFKEKLDRNYSVFDVYHIRDAYFLNAELSGGSQYIFRSTKPEGSWNLVFTHDNFSFSPANADFAFFNDSIGYELTSCDLVKTTDKGYTWEVKFTLKDSLWDLRFFDENTIWFLSSFQKKMFHSTDGGNTFQTYSLPCTTHAYYFANINQGLLGDYLGGGSIYRTENGGRDWELAFQLPQGTKIHYLYMRNEANAWISISINNETYTSILRTTDGGYNWEQCKGETGFGKFIDLGIDNGLLTMSPISSNFSIDGINWIKIRQYLRGHNSGVRVYPTEDNRLLGFGDSNGYNISTDEGYNWTEYKYSGLWAASYGVSIYKDNWWIGVRDY